MAAYALTIFLSAFLLFQVQPLIGKYILPWFGGGPGVWTTCMLFFQLVLLAGYGYAHASTRLFKPRVQVLLHAGLLLGALVLLPVIPADVWKPDGSGNPTLQILLVLAASVGLPYLVLSATSPLIQIWFRQTNPGASPYRLFALSNAGSLLALLSFPVWFEPHYTRKTQAVIWGWGLAAYAVGCALCGLQVWHARPPAETSPEPGSVKSASLVCKILWWLLPACGSVLLLATTNKMCQDVAVIPFLWVLPLGLYLLSFIICFDSPRWYQRLPFALGLIAAMGAACWALFRGTELSIYVQVAIYSAGLFVCCMICHGELYRLRPAPERLTGFYLSIAAGGAIGGIFVAIVAPLIFKDYYELHCGLLMCGLLFIWVCLRDRASDSSRQWRALFYGVVLLAAFGLDRALVWAGHQSNFLHAQSLLPLRISWWAIFIIGVGAFAVARAHRFFNHWRLAASFGLALGLFVLGALLWKQGNKSSADVIHTSRNFYGVLTVYEHDRDDPLAHHRLLQHGRITHGLQFLDPSQSQWPISYYNDASGVAKAVRALGDETRRIGVIGLGTGTMAAYGRAGDYLRIYEINPAVKLLATSSFSYLSNSHARIEVAMGDARLSMERESPEGFNLLVLDAFSSDAIPVHLLTREAFASYERHMQTNGVIAVHISNHYLDLEPVVANLAREFNYRSATIDYDDTENEEEWWNYSSTWVLLTRSEERMKKIVSGQIPGQSTTRTKNIPLWTDDFVSLFQILRK